VHSHQSEPLISICVPTHDGRCEVLAELLEGVIDQARDLPGQVEICVSDNASQDGTAELLAKLSSCASCPVVYRRHAKDEGLARNLLASVELARGRYCWLLGSDDLLAPAALRRVCELLDEMPNATGYVVGALHVDAEDPTLRSRSLLREFHPPGEQSHLIEGCDDIYDKCGNAWCALSWSIVDREAWLSASQQNTGLVLAHPVFPQIVMLAAMAADRPCWGWFAEPLVHQRNAITFLFERGDASLADRWIQIIDGVAAAWGAVLDHRGTSGWRRRMRLLHKVWGGTADMRATKLYENPTLGAQARLALTCLYAFWPVSNYWRDVLPATLMPTWLTRARYGEGSWLRRRAGDLPKLTLSAQLPARMVAGSVQQVTVEAHNDDQRTILSEGARAVTIGQRWRKDEGRLLGPGELGLNELAALPQSLPQAVHAGRVIRAKVMLYAPVETGIYHLEIDAHQHGYGWLNDFGIAQVIARTIEVIAQG
jgi:Glycosyl transferase family 2